MSELVTWARVSFPIVRLTGETDAGLKQRALHIMSTNPAEYVLDALAVENIGANKQTCAIEDIPLHPPMPAPKAG